MLPAALIGCSTSMFTGERQIAQEAKALPYGVIQASPLNEQTTYYVGQDNLRIRTAGQDAASSAGLLNLGDRVKVLNPEAVSDQGYVEISVVKAANGNVKRADGMRYFIKKEYLSEKLVNYKEVNSKYFVVVNLASETLRLYERMCADNSCPHKMILETEVVVGENKVMSTKEKGKGRTTIGSFRITEWIKFYDDGGGYHPAWYFEGTKSDRKGNSTPIAIPPRNSPLSWFKETGISSKLIGFKGEKYMLDSTPDGSMRGAFGWYTAKVHPEAYGQWTHGTMGWGEDKDMAISRAKGRFVNIISNPRSSGCTRNNNEAIAYIRHMIDIGTPIVKIYAKEAVADASLSRYPDASPVDWSYILTKNTKFHTIEREEVLKALNVSGEDVDAFWKLKREDQFITAEKAGFSSKALNNILEVGTYQRDIHPDAFPWNDGKSGKVRTGNVYGIKPQYVKGTFYVDTGMLEGYQPPTIKNLGENMDPAQLLEFYGFKDEETPPFMDIKNLK